MNAPELLYGKRAPGTIAVSPAPLDLAASDPVTIENAEISYSLFEIRMAVAEALLPTSLHPSVPALMGITFIHAAAGALGRFTLAYAGVACRTGIKPRHLITNAYCDSTSAAEFFATRYGFACRAAAVESRETYDRVHGSIAIDGNTVLEVNITDCLPLVGAGALIKYSPPLNAATLSAGPGLVQFEAVYDFKRVTRGRPRVVQCAPAALGDPALQPTFAIAGSHAVVDLTLMPMRFEVDLEVPAETGGARKIVR